MDDGDNTLKVLFYDQVKELKGPVINKVPRVLNPVDGGYVMCSFLPLWLHSPISEYENQTGKKFIYLFDELSTKNQTYYNPYVQILEPVNDKNNVYQIKDEKVKVKNFSN